MTKTSKTMQMKTLLGERVAIIPDKSEAVTKGGIIIPVGKPDPTADDPEGVIAKKGTGTPWNPLDDLKVKQRIRYKRGSGMKHEEIDEEGNTVEYLILSYSEIVGT